MTIKIHKTYEGAHLPEFKTTLAAGADLAVPGDSAHTVKVPHGRSIVCLEFRIALPEGYEAQIRPRSGCSLKGMVDAMGHIVQDADVLLGTIDADYRGKVGVIILNRGDDFCLCGGTRIAQMVVSKVEHPDYEESPDLDDTERGEGGFGSTGT